MRNQATTLFNKRLHALRKEKIIIISLYLMVISWSFTYFAGCIYFWIWRMVKTHSNEYQFCINSSSDCCVDIHFPMRPLLKEADKIFYYHLKTHVSIYASCDFI